MKNRSIFAEFTLIVVIFGLFAACSNPSGSNSSNTDTSNINPPNPNLITVPGGTLAEKLQWLIYNAEDDKNYLLEVSSTYESLAPQNLYYAGRSNITIWLRGNSSNRVIEFSSKGNSLFTITNGITLVLDNNITLIGKNDNDKSLIMVNTGGTLLINKGVKISGNSSPGGGVYVASGTFTMSGGEISGNTASASSSSSFYLGGGGVYVANGTFTMSGGEISGNTASYPSSSSYPCGGGGVYVAQSWSSYFEKTGGTIYGYTAGEIKSNVVKEYYSDVVQNNCGHAVYTFYYYDDGSYLKRKETTSGPGDNLSYDRRVNPPISTGVWDN